MRLIPAMTSRATVALAPILAAAWASPGLAQNGASIDSLDTAKVIATQSCAGIEKVVPEAALPDVEDEDKNRWRAVPTRRVAYFLASHSGVMVAPGDALDLVRSLDDREASEPAALKDMLYHVQTILIAKDLNGLRAFDGPGTAAPTYASPEHNRAWMMRPNIILRCKLPRTATPPSKANPSLRLRGTVAALSAVGEDRLGAAAATIGYTRTRTFQDDGSRTQATDLAVNAVLGAIFDVGAGNALMLYGGYELKRNRVVPPPTLVPPATQRDGDTDIVTLGAGIGRYLPLGGKDNRYAVSLNLRFDGAYKFDLVKDSERAEGQFTASLYTQPRSLGICGFGGFTDFGNGFWSRCDLVGMVRYGKFTKRGLLPASAKDEFAHAGGKASIALYAGDPGDNAAFLSAEYLYMPRIDGDPAAVPNVRRHKINMGYRWWKNSAYALEVKGELTDGINPDSFADENVVTVGFGIIF